MTPACVESEHAGRDPAPRHAAAADVQGATASPVYAFRSSPSMIDYPGRLAGVMFTTGCNFRCGFCHNAALLAKRRQGMPWSRLEQRCDEWRAEWVDGVVVTGGEPTLCEDLVELLVRLKRFGFAIKLDTNGSRPDVLLDCIELVDYVAMDIKIGLSRYPELTGYEHLEHIRQSIALIQSRAADYEFRTTVIEAYHSHEQMAEIADMIRGARRYVMQPFVPKDNLVGQAFRDMPRMSAERLQELAAPVRSAVRELTVRG